MEESQEILLKSLASSGVPIPTGVSSIRDLTPATLVSICAQTLRLIDDTSSFPTSLPDSTTHQFKLSSDLADAFKNLGFIGDMSFHKFLYPSEDDLYKLMRFLVEKLSELSEVGKTAGKQGINTSATAREVDFKSTSKHWIKKADKQGVDPNDKEVRTRLKDLGLQTEVPIPSNSKAEDEFVRRPCEVHPFPTDETAAVDIPRSRMQDSSEEEATNIKRSLEVLEDSRINASVNEETTGQRAREVHFKGTSKDWIKKADKQGVDPNDKEVRTRLKGLGLQTEVPIPSNSKAEDEFVRRPCEVHPFPTDETAAVDIPRSKMQDSSEEEATSMINSKRSLEELEDSRINAYVNEETTGQRDDDHVSEPEQKLVSLREQASKIRCESDILRSQEKVLMEEVTAKTLESQHLEEEHELLKAAAEMAFDEQHPAEFYIVQFNEQINARRQKLVELESQWDTLRKTLEEKRRSLDEVLSATKPETREKLQKLKDIELEIQCVLSETKKREEEHSKLSADLQKKPKLESRRSYIQRVAEITKNSRKQDADIERILKETRELQLESNSIQERLHRTYTVVDETVFREAKKDPVARECYRLLVSIHESFEQISEKILATDRTQREVAEHEAKLAALASRSINIDKLQADLDAIKKENEFLEQHSHDTQNPKAHPL